MSKKYDIVGAIVFSVVFILLPAVIIMGVVAFHMKRQHYEIGLCKGLGYEGRILDENGDAVCFKNSIKVTELTKQLKSSPPNK